MDRETIVKLARDAGWPDSLVAPVIMDKLADFAKLVAEHEREACAKVCDWVAAEWKSDSKTAIDCAAAIRARGNT